MLSNKLLMELEKFIDNHLNKAKLAICESSCQAPLALEYIPRKDIVSFVANNRKQTFNELLFAHIDKVGVKDSEIYRRAFIDRRHFSKIRSNPDYQPSKNTAIALALALNLTFRQGVELIESAGYTLSESQTFDLVIKFCFEKKIYSIHDVNLALEYFSLKPLI